MDYINHITLNSGHLKKSFPRDVNKEFFFILKRVYKESFDDNGIELSEKYIVKSTHAKGHGVVTTIFDLYNVPILTSAFVNEKESKMWEVLHSSSDLPLATNIANPPNIPYIADRAEIGKFINIDTLEWIADFSRCLAWIHFSSKSIL